MCLVREYLLYLAFYLIYLPSCNLKSNCEFVTLIPFELFWFSRDEVERYSFDVAYMYVSVIGTRWEFVIIGYLLYVLAFIVNNCFKGHPPKLLIPGCVAQSVTCMTTDAYLNADPGVASGISARSHTFMEIDHEIISRVILLPSADLFKEGCCHLSVTSESMCLRYWLLAKEKSVVRWTVRPDMTIMSCLLGSKATNQTRKP